MAWRIEFERSAERELDKLDRETTTRILRFLQDRLSPSNDPRSLGEALKGSRLGGLWKYRVGDYRIIASIEDETVRIGHRRAVYR
ncbi:hypothetical protein AFCDBAGC_2579 [Methylobacterium cerastii]|uniref:Type II toxin-antitoxin system RelE/ParE family toxin n=1 Tax=Methylobacterium cerastii TaxID=932741 RepID=A0ABQ4QHL8_9HYPH|nr:MULTISPECIES: type II toxin-antitoxin system RelE/ParE family toxin [Methylobacterium]TXM94555.1 type II toxin-antitoxin system RelE/ParE family toxin [Methylobacterium sp. WL122]TXN81717.1 type II toxin-antitoxin system RelE/ParE family toxin [Methylobacterium sp. WL8]GJD44712.1 hypothetical protein AFCDBAGC_2579 [Methylobacterium cerastii]